MDKKSLVLKDELIIKEIIDFIFVVLLLGTLFCFLRFISYTTWPILGPEENWYRYMLMFFGTYLILNIPIRPFRKV